MVACTATLNDLAAYYVGKGNYVGLATGAPGTSATPANEATGGTPAYARKSITWSAGSTGVQTTATPATIDVAAGTYNYGLLASAASGNNMYDNASMTAVVMGAQGQIVCTPTITFT